MNNPILQTRDTGSVRKVIFLKYIVIGGKVTYTPPHSLCHLPELTAIREG